MAEKSAWMKLKNLLGGSHRAQERIDEDYMNILDPASQLPVADLQELVKMATILRDAIAAWEYSEENAKPKSWIALARKACYAVGYIVRRFQTDAALCAAFVAYKPHLDQIKRYLENIVDGFASGSSGENGREIKRLEQGLENTFACLELSRGDIVGAIISRSFICAREELAEKTGQPKRPSSYYAHNQHDSSASLSTYPVPSHDDNNDADKEREMDPNAEVYHPPVSSSKSRRPTSSNITKADSNSEVSRAPGQRQSTHLRIDMKTVKRISEATTPSPYDSEDDRLYDPYTSPVSSTRSPMKSAYSECDKPVTPTRGSTSKSAFANPSSSVMLKVNSRGYVKDCDDETSAMHARVTNMPTYSEPEEMAPEGFGSAPDPQAPPNAPTYYERPHYDHAPASAPGPVAHAYHHRPPYNPAQSYPPYHQYAPHPPWVHPHPPVMMHQDSAPGVYISNSLNQFGNTTTHIFEGVSKPEKKKKSRASTSKATMSHQYD